MNRSAIPWSALLIGALIGLVSCEILLRFVAPQWTDQWKMWRIDPVYARGLRPGVEDAVVHGHSGEFAFHFSTNEQGLRMDGPLTATPAPGTRRTLVVGDSFAFGYGVGQADPFPAVLEAALRERGQRVEIVNAGFASGFTLDTEYLFSREVGARWRPDEVLIAVCLSNDLADLGRTVWHVDGDRLVRVSKDNDRVPLFLKRSALVNLFAKGLVPRVRDWLTPEVSETVLPPCAADRSGVTVPETPPIAIEPGTDVTGLQPEARVDWILDRWSRDAADAGVGLSMLMIPDAEEVEWPASASRLAEWGRIRAVFESAARRRGIRVFDPLRAMQRHACAGGAKLYFERDGHWSAEGHRFVARWLADAFEASSP